MTGQQLKNSILQEAIEGRLVPQDPNDEPASVLLERIRAEKARLVKEKKIKKDKNESRIYRTEDGHWMEHFEDKSRKDVCIDDEIPFDVPSGWEWCRFGCISINRDYERVPLSVSQRSNLAKIYDYYGASGVIDKVDKFLFDKDLLLIGEDGANLINRSTPIAFIAKGKYWVNNHAHVLDFINTTNMQYVMYFINAISLVDYVTGTAQPKMNQEKMNSILVSLPPLAEQHRIVEKIESLLPKVDAYGKAQEELEKLNEALPEQLKKSILQEAIEGRLVPQDPNDEPASVLFERIRAEKARLVKEKKIKKDKNESRIYRTEDGHWMEHFEDKSRKDVCIDDEIPFDVPSGWEWCRLGILFDHTSGKQQSCNNKGGGTPQKFITTSNLYWGYFNLDNVKVMNFTEQEIQSCSATMGDLLVCEGGAGYGRSAIWDKDYDICLQNHVHRLRPIIKGVCEYVYYYIYLLKESNQLASVGTAMPGLSANRLKGLYVPLPPLAEQHRIVEKIESLLPKIEKLKVKE